MTSGINGSFRQDLYNISSQTGINEVRFQKLLSGLAVAVVATTPLTGPIGLAYGGAVLAGKFIRKFVRRDAREAYLAQKTLANIQRREEYAEGLRRSSSLIENQLREMDTLEVDRVNGATITERRNLFGRRKLQTRLEYD